MMAGFDDELFHRQPPNGRRTGRLEWRVDTATCKRPEREPCGNQGDNN